MEIRLIYDASQLVTVDPAKTTAENPLGIIENGALLIEDGKIAWLGRSDEINPADFPEALKPIAVFMECDLMSAPAEPERR